MSEVILKIEDDNLFIINGEETIEKAVKPQGNGAHVTVPKAWLGSQVKITRVSDTDTDNSE